MRPRGGFRAESRLTGHHSPDTATGCGTKGPVRLRRAGFTMKVPNVPGRCPVIPVLHSLIVLFLAVLIVAGPALERLLDRIWPPDDRTPQDSPRR